MAMSAPQMADEIAAAISEGYTSDWLICLSNGIVTETRKGVATFGVIPSPHTISGISGTQMATLVYSCRGYNYLSVQLDKFCWAVADHTMGKGIVTYAGPPIYDKTGWLLGGKISGLDGNVLAALVVQYEGFGYVSDRLIRVCTAIVNHIMANAEVTSGVIA